jgi:hypothetical protein
LPRILIVECMQEISSFDPLQSEYDNFHMARGAELFGQRSLNTALGGAFQVFDPRPDARGRFAPLPATARVKLLSDGQARLKTSGAKARCRPHGGAGDWPYDGRGIQPQRQPVDAWVEKNFHLDIAGASRPTFRPSATRSVPDRFSRSTHVAFHPVPQLYRRTGA